MDKIENLRQTQDGTLQWYDRRASEWKFISVGDLFDHLLEQYEKIRILTAEKEEVKPEQITCLPTVNSSGVKDK